MPGKLALSLSLTAFLLAACDRSPQQERHAAPAPAPAPDYLARINQLAPAQRNATFYRAITDAGFICDAVSTSQAQAAVQGFPAWDARCSDGQHWILVLAGDGILQVFKSAAVNEGPKDATTGSIAGPSVHR